MENLHKAIQAIGEKEAVAFKDAILTELLLRVGQTLDQRRVSIAHDILEANVLAPSASPATPPPSGKQPPSGVTEKPMDEDLMKELQAIFGIGAKADETKPVAKDDDVSLDPNFEKEYLTKSFAINGVKVQFKQIGLGLSKPIRVYVDGQRWELFPGPEAAIQATKQYVKELAAEAKKKESANQGA